MRTKIFLYFVLLLIGICTSLKVKAQLINIPDPNLLAYLNQNYPSCMVGNSIDASCPSVLNTTVLGFTSQSISSFEGLEAFSNLLYLNVSNNPGAYIPSLPSVININYSNCYINWFPNWYGIETVDCINNPIGNLSWLPSSLKYLFIANNQMTSLPTLPPNLILLSSAGNNIPILPALPSSLKFLYITYGNLSSLPTLPPSLTELTCISNQLTTLPSLPNSLITLDCSYNQITSIPTLPNSLQTLICNNNLLYSLPELPNTLVALSCQSNQLTCLPNLNKLKTLNFLNNQINCVPGYWNLTTCNPPITGFPLCDVFNSNGCDIFWNIEGTTFHDIDTNCILGTTDFKIKNQKINLYKNGVLEESTFTNINGNFDFNTSSYNVFTTQFDSSGSLFNVQCPSTTFYIDTISAIDSLKYSRNFGLNCKGVDLGAININSEPFRPAGLRMVKIQAGDLSNFYGGSCASGISGTVVINITGDCSYYSSPVGALAPTLIAGNTLTFNIADFGTTIFDSSFNFIVLVDSNAVAGSQICIQVSISTISTEINYNNNLLSQCFTVVNSFDPNDKSVNPSSTLDISGGRWLNYKIRFQNTGTAVAEHIFITDTLSNSLDWTTFSLLDYSHPPITQLYSDGLLKFSFPSINLPDSNSNEPDSHGYIQFKIRAQDSLPVGSLIANTANIFFDFNPPVITNTTYNTIINCSIPSTNIDITICEGQNYQLNNVVYTYQGTYQQKIITTAGCDSVISLNLTVIPRINNLSLNLCDGDNFDFNGQQLSNSGVYYDTLSNVLGCDSIIILNLTFLPPFSTSQSTTICSNDSILFGGVYLNQTGTFTDSLFSIYGCDSVITLSISVNSSYNNQLLQTICDGDSVLFGGSWINLPGIYYDSLTTIQGCDSTLVLELLFDTFNNSVFQSNDTLFTSQTGTGTTYQWFNCNSNIAINGANGQTFSPSQSGNYAVIVSNGLCSDTSNCLFFSATGIGELNAGVLLNSNYSQYDNSIHIRLDGLPNGGFLTLTDLRGRSLQTITIPSDGNIQRQIHLPASNLANGMYLIHLIGEKVDLSAKIVK